MRFYLQTIFGEHVQIKVLEVLLQNALEEEKSEGLLWQTFSKIAKEAKVAKSSARRILEDLLKKNIIEEKLIKTHAQQPPRYVRLNLLHPAVPELLFFYRKVRGVL